MNGPPSRDRFFSCWTIAAPLLTLALAGGCAREPTFPSAWPQADVSAEDLEPYAVSLAEGGALELLAVQRVRDETKGQLNAEGFVIRTQVLAVEIEAARWATVEIRYRPRKDCDLASCKFENPCGSFGQSAIVLFHWSRYGRFRGTKSLHQAWIHVAYTSSLAEFDGLLGVTGMTKIEGANAPWIGIRRQGCDAVTFDLSGPGPEGWGIYKRGKPR